jgi:xylan 1,4-beta-xylosidase
MGRPAVPTREQISRLRAAAELTAPETAEMTDGKLEISVPTQGLAVVEIR